MLLSDIVKNTFHLPELLNDLVVLLDEGGVLIDKKLDIRSKLILTFVMMVLDPRHLILVVLKLRDEQGVVILEFGWHRKTGGKKQRVWLFRLFLISDLNQEIVDLTLLLIDDCLEINVFFL
jgi:hypothetical protein